MHGPLALFMVQTAIVIVSARSIGLVVRKLRQPMVIAEIVAGIVLGPSLLGWLAPRAEAVLFPSTSLALLSLASQIGLILFMFLIGLELDPKLLRGRTHTSVAISHSSIVLPFALGAGLAVWLYPTLSSPSVRFSSFFLFMGVAMSITAFPVLARILVEQRLLKTKVGTIAIACAAIDDVTAWCILAFVVSIARSSGLGSAVRTTLLAVAYIALMLGVVRPFARRFSDRTKSGVSQNIVAVTLLLLLLSSWLTELIGIHALFGAFVLGAIVPKEGGFARHLAEKMEDLVVVFFLPLFFAFSGLRTQIGLLDTPRLWVTCAIIVATACVGKFGGSAIAARLTGLPWREASAIGILMNTRGLVELVVLNIGYDLGVISPRMFTMLVIMALLTTFMTTPLLSWVYPIEELSKELAEPDESPSAARAFTVLACVSYEHAGPPLITLGAALSGKEPARGRLYALRLVRPSEGSSFVLEQSEARPDEQVLGPVVARAREVGVQVRPISFVSNRPGGDICEVAQVKHADLVLLGWHKPILGGTMLSGTVHDVMAGTPADVGVFIDRGLRQLKNILVPFLGSDHDRAALRLARRIAENEGARVTILHVVRPDRHFDVRQEMNQVFDEPAVGGRATTVELKLVQHESPVEAVIDAAAGYDLVLIGVGREWGLEHRAFGILSEHVLRRSPTSVLVVRQGDQRMQGEAEKRPPANKAGDSRLVTLPVQ